MVRSLSHGLQPRSSFSIIFPHAECIQNFRNETGMYLIKNLIPLTIEDERASSNVEWFWQNFPLAQAR